MKKLIEKSKAAKKELAKRHLIDFLEYDSNYKWKRAKHLNLLCKKLEEIEKGNLKRLMVFLPPRHGKSEVVSKKFPAWYLGKNPDKEIILSSYAADLAYDFSRIARNTLKEHNNTFGRELASDSSAIKNWNIEGYDGGLTAAGVGGPITGRGANVAIIDDPVKNWEEASSKTYRDKVWKWYQSVLRTRLTPNGAIVLVMTRWHEDDLAGRLLKQEGDNWDIVNFPAIAKEEDILGREEGEALWPERYPISEIEDIRNTLLDRMFLSLYQQEPRKTEESALWNYDIIKNVNEYPNLKKVIVAIDPATSNNSNSDETGIIGAGIGPNNFGYVLEDRSTKASPNGWAKKAISAYNEYKADAIIAEVNQGGDMVESVIRSQDRNVSYKEVRASRGKTIRAEPIASLYEQGKVFHVGKFTKLENQLTTWEQGNDSPDRLDALVWALTELMLNNRKSRVIGKPSGF